MNKKIILFGIIAGLIITFAPLKIFGFYTEDFEECDINVQLPLANCGWNGSTGEGSTKNIFWTATTTPYSGQQSIYVPRFGEKSAAMYGNANTDYTETTPQVSGYQSFRIWANCITDANRNPSVSVSIGQDNVGKFAITIAPLSQVYCTAGTNFKVIQGGEHIATITPQEYHEFLIAYQDNYFSLYINGDLILADVYSEFEYLNNIALAKASEYRQHPATSDGMTTYIDDFVWSKMPIVWEPDPGATLTYSLFHVYGVSPRGYYQVPQNYKYQQDLSIQWKPETRVIWSCLNKARLELVNVADLASTKIELPFDERFCSYDGLLGAGSRDYELAVEFATSTDSGVYAVFLDFYQQHLFDWEGDWSDKKLLGYWTLPDIDTGEYPEWPEGVPILPDEFFTDEPGWLIQRFNEVKYNFPFGYYFLIEDMFKDIEVSPDEELPGLVKANLTFAGEVIELPVFGLGQLNEAYPDFFTQTKTILTVMFWALFIFYVYERIIHKQPEIGFNR